MIHLFRPLPSKQQIYLFFLAVLFPINFWAWIGFLRELPSYLLRLPIWNIIGILAYLLTIALVESILLFSFILLLSLLFPPVRTHFPGLPTIWAYLTILWVLPFHYADSIVGFLPFTGQTWFIGIWMFALPLSYLTAAILFQRNHRLDAVILGFLDRLSVLSAVYLVFNAAAVVIVFVRNLTGSLS